MTFYKNCGFARWMSEEGEKQSQSLAEKNQMTLTGDRRRQLHDALISAYYTEPKLKQFVRLQLDKNPDVVGTGADLAERVLKLIENAESHGWEAQLIFAARESNPGNPKLSAFVRIYETEYLQQLAQRANSYELEEVDAESAIFQVKAEVLRVINNQPHVNDQLMCLLVEIRDKLNEPGPTAAAKAKLALNLIPGFLVYEFELDTENSLRRLRQPIVQLFQKALNEGK
ncbi:effector-associated domain EAD1-containing protein [Microcoleus sp. K1-B6]|uniref:effector-associated domain EAD1-containing protein n=1 Tax=unclassified Microcoleus TaxID=2642155 RepID=UPI002FCF0F91